MRMKSLVLLSLVFVIGCTTSGHKDFYTQLVDIAELPDVEPLPESEEPKIFTTEDIERDAQILLSKRFVVLGFSSFNGSMERDSLLMKQAEAVGASIVLLSVEHTDSKRVDSSMSVPTSSTTYHSGNFTTNSGYGSFSGTSTTFGTRSIPFSFTVERYDQMAAFFVKSKNKLRVGMSTVNLTPQLRQTFERNSGALIDVVVEDTPAFDANLLSGDLVIAIEGEPVRNAEHLRDLMMALPSGNITVTITIIRNSVEKEITLNLE